MDFLFEDEDFMHYKDFYDTFGTELFYSIGYDNRIIELLPREKKELEKKIKNNGLVQQPVVWAFSPNKLPHKSCSFSAFSLQNCVF